MQTNYTLNSQTIHTTASILPPIKQIEKRLDPFMFLSGSGKAMRTSIKKLRKIGKAVKSEGLFTRFMQKNPLVKQLLLFSELLSLFHLVITLPKLKKSCQDLIKKRGFKRLDAGSKVFSTFGKALKSFATILATLETANLAKTLGMYGLKTAQIFFTASFKIIDHLSLIGTILTLGGIFHKGCALREKTKNIKDFKAHTWYKKEGNYTAKEYQLFRKFCIEMSDETAKALGKQLRIHKTAVRAVLCSKVQAETPSKEDLTDMRRCITTLVGQLKVNKRICQVQLLTSSIKLISTASIFIPPLEPCAVLLMCASAASKIALLIFRDIHQYQFEKKLGLLKESSSGSLKNRALHFAKWKLQQQPHHSLFEQGASTALFVSKDATFYLKFISSCLDVAKTFSKL